MGSLRTYKNIAFISYNHEDMAVAKKLHRKLDNWRLPSSIHKARPELPTRLREIFRDIDGLHAGGDLTDQIKEQLRNSRYLIVVCSPNAAQSDWVDKEVAYFQELGREKDVIPFIIGGKPYVGGADECFTSTMCALHSQKGWDPASANINENGFDHACIKVVADMLHIEFDSLWQRHLREEKRKRVWGLLSAVFVVLISIGLILLFAYQNAQIKAERDRAIVLNDSIKLQNVLIVNQRDSLSLQNECHPTTKHSHH